MEQNPNVIANLGNFGSGLETEIDGKKLKFKLVDQSVKAALENKLVLKAKLLLKNEKIQLSDDEFKLAWESHSEAVVSGKYSFGSRTMQSFLGTPHGIATLLSICSSESLEFWEDTLLQSPLDCSLIIKQLLDLSFPKLKKSLEMTDQND